MTLSFISYGQLVKDTLEMCHNFTGLTRRSLFGVIGIPKSGMIPAQVIASRLSLPLADLEYFLSTGGRFYPNRGGRSGQYWSDPYHRDSTGGTIMVVDDSVHEGSTLREVDFELGRHLLAGPLSYSITAIYGTGHCKEFHYCKEVPLPRIFEWNWTKHPILQQSFLDMDGVICRDWHGPRDDEPETIKQYERWLETVEPLYLPTKTVYAIASAREEKYRIQTEAWLSRWGVRYENLWLSQKPISEMRKNNSHWEHKAQLYGESRSTLFIESEGYQAVMIKEKTGKEVFCPPAPGREGMVYG